VCDVFVFQFVTLSQNINLLIKPLNKTKKLNIPMKSYYIWYYRLLYRGL